MKKSVEIIETILKNSAEIARIDETLRKAPYSAKKIDSKLIALAEKQINLQIENRILHDNARRALYEEIMPIAIKIINKYAGKPYGEKTKQKIREALIEKANCAVYMSNRFDGEISLVPLNKEGYSTTIFRYDEFNIYTKYIDGKKEKILVDNKIQFLTMDALVLSDCAAYVDNVSKRVDEIKAAFTAAQEAQETLENACKQFNSLVPRGIENLYSNHIRSYMF